MCCSVHHAHGSHAVAQRDVGRRGARHDLARDAYGYDVVRRLRTAGLTDIGDASVYGTLRRLYKAGALTSYVVGLRKGRTRNYYGITTTSRGTLEQARATWADFSRLLDALLSSTEVTTV